MAQMKPIGVLPKPGAVVSARREADDDEYEPATVKSSDLSAGTISLRFADGYQAAVPLSQVKLDMPPAGEAPLAAPAAPDEPRVEELDHGYETEVRPTLPTPPTAQALAADPEAKYAYIAAGKDVGNALFKQGKYAWAIRTYCDAVDTLAATCYASRERMLWDYQAREPCAQCFSNAALCALKQSEFTRAAELCGYAMECRPEEADLLKVLLRHGQALAGLGQLEAAKEKLERGMQPTNRPLREELQKVKKALLELDKHSEKRLFASVDLGAKGLTSKKESFAAQLEATLAKGHEQMYDSKDEQALKTLSPLLDGRLDEEKHLEPLSSAAYGCGIASYHTGSLEGAITQLQLFFRLREGRDDLPAPLGGVPLARFYLGHAPFNTQSLQLAQQHLTAYLQEVAAQGPQPVLNMPDGWQGRKISEADRKASRLRHRAAGEEAQSDAHMMLALISQRTGAIEDAVRHCEECVRLALPDTAQRLAAHKEAVRIYAWAGRDEEADAHRGHAAATQEAIDKKVEEEKAKKAKEDQMSKDAKEAPPFEPEAGAEAEEAGAKAEERGEGEWVSTEAKEDAGEWVSTEVEQTADGEWPEVRPPK